MQKSRAKANNDMRMGTHLPTQAEERAPITIQRPIHEPLRIYMPRTRKAHAFRCLASTRLSVPDNSAQRSAFVVGTRIGVGLGNTPGAKKRELGAAEKNAALYYMNMVLQERPARQHRAPSMRNPNILPCSPKKIGSRGHRWKTKIGKTPLTNAYRAGSAACGT
ncbi:hypothetical protein B0H13DRAFT_1893911 [Mycena leptocephala]|nr:hypothetical protein B0H13DRAFT_1893911 [Mycena leptocephala]